MLTKTLNLSRCNEGDILAADIMNNMGVTLAAKDTIINEYMKQKLAVHGIGMVRIYIKSDYSNSHLQNDYMDTLAQTKEIFQDLVSGKPLDCEGISGIADKIFNTPNEYDKIIRCLDNVHGVDEYTYTHSVNVAFYSMLITKWLELSDNRIKTSIKAGLLHDIGKIKIPDQILNKKGKLTDEEFEIIKNHTVHGYNILKDVDEIDDAVKKAVLLHHERIDGSGYPYHFYSDNLNIYSRIIAIADVFDAMTSDRVYKGRSTPFDVFEMFQTSGIGIFDINMLNIFMKRLSGYLVGSKVLLKDGRKGEIVYVPVQAITHPIVKVESEYIDLLQFSETKIIRMIGSVE